MTAIQWDNFLCGYDTDADGTIGTVSSPDAGDYVYAAYDFDDPPSSVWEQLTLTHDAAGNLVDDGLLKYTYDPWNPRRAAQHQTD